MDYKKTVEEWLSSGELTDEEIFAINNMSDEQQKEAFFAPLAFGTAGMRGVLEPGINRMNRFTVRRATKGLADYIIEQGRENDGVVISYDTRKFSAEFAILAAEVLTQNNIRAYLFSDVHPVPLCSFAVRRLKAFAGIMITASHNPKIYNGYKVYGEDGAQMSPESTEKVVKYISQTPYFHIATKRSGLTPESLKKLDFCKLSDRLIVIGSDVDDMYFDEIQKLSLSPDEVKKYGKDIKIVYTPVHGSGFKPVRSILSRMGISVNIVLEQAVPDSDFPTVRVPNPEEADTLKMGVELAKMIGSDIVIGTDPDADRMGVAVKNDSGEFVLLNGNQIGVLLLYYILRRKKETGTLPSNGAIVKTIVTTELARAIANDFGVTTFDVLTGFKFIGEKIKEWEESGEFVYLFGFEESYGSLVGTHARDKDAVVASMMFAEMVCYLKGLGVTVYDLLQQIFARYGYFKEKAISVTFGGLDGMSKMADIMLKLRHTRFSQVAGVKVLSQSDFVDGVTYVNSTPPVEHPIDLPKTNALKLQLEGGDWICVRPSGTEPKLKFYAASSKSTMDAATKQADAYLSFMSELAK